MTCRGARGHANLRLGLRHPRASSLPVALHNSQAQGAGLGGWRTVADYCGFTG